MRVFKPTRKDKSGRQKPYAKWYVEFRDHAETIRRIPAFTDKKQSEELGRKLEKLVACRANGESPDTTLGRWLESVPARIRDKLAKIGLLEGRTVAAGKPLLEHVRDFEAALSTKGHCDKHVRQVVNEVTRVVTECGFGRISDIDGFRVEVFLGELRESGLSVQTCNHYLSALRQFVRWLVRNRRTVENPIAHLEPGNVELDRRRVRRALSADEIERLLVAAANSPQTVYGLTGADDRFVVYYLALGSGLRASEVASLTPESFHLDSPTPNVAVAAGTSKRRRRDEQPLQPDVAAILRDYLADKPTGRAVWPGRWSERAAEMFRVDLEAAGIPYVDDSGQVADFHSQRHTYITVAAKTLPPRMAQALARHSTPTLTERYTRLELHDTGAAAAQLPPLIPDDRPQAERLLATGTDGDSKRGESVALCVARKGAERSNSVQSGAVKGVGVEDSQKCENPQKTRENAEKTSGWGGNRTPAGRKPRAVTKAAVLAAMLA